MAVDKRPQFKQPAKQPRGVSDAKKSEPKSDFGMVRADPHDPYERPRKKGKDRYIDGFGHVDKGDF